VKTFSCKCGPVFEVQWARNGRAVTKALRRDGITEVGDRVIGMNEEGLEAFSTEYQCDTCHGVIHVPSVREPPKPS
jgi:hypothetical protein